MQENFRDDVICHLRLIYQIFRMAVPSRIPLQVSDVYSYNLPPALSIFTKPSTYCRTYWASTNGRWQMRNSWIFKEVTKQTWFALALDSDTNVGSSSTVLLRTCTLTIPQRMLISLIKFHHLILIWQHPVRDIKSKYIVLSDINQMINPNFYFTFFSIKVITFSRPKLSNLFSWEVYTLDINSSLYDSQVPKLAFLLAT